MKRMHPFKLNQSGVDKMKMKILFFLVAFFYLVVPSVVLSQYVFEDPCEPSEMIPGDLNGDDIVDTDDLNIVLGCFGQTVAANPACAIADVAPPPDGDGFINILDISYIGSLFTQ